MPADLHDLGLGERLRHVGGQSRPLRAVDLAVERERGCHGCSRHAGCVVGGHPDHRIVAVARMPRLAECTGWRQRTASRRRPVHSARTRPLGAPRRATLQACASESSTSARTPSTCSSPMCAREGGRSRPRASAPCCASCATSTPTASITEEGVRALGRGGRRGARGRRRPSGSTSCWPPRPRPCARRRTAPAVIARIEEALGQPLQVLGGETEARFTFLAVRRWFGWAAGQILLFDIGGGSLEIAAGSDELPGGRGSVPLGAGRMTMQFLPDDPPGPEAVDALRAHARGRCSRPVAERFARAAASRSRRRLVEGDPVAREARRLPGAGLVGHRADACSRGASSRLVDSAPRAHPRRDAPGAARHHRRPHVPDRRRRGRAAPGDEGDGRRRARGVARGRCAKACCCATSSRCRGTPRRPEP